MSDATSLTAREIARRVGAREASAVDVARACLARAEALNPGLNAFLDLDDADVLEQARRADERAARGEVLPLAGVPVALKDNLCAEGRPTTAGSRMLAGWRAPYDATCVARLRAAGAVLFGKTNCDEFAMGSSNEHSAFGPVRNPWNAERVPGGSSGGSAAAVAARVVPLALGSDTGGSIRQPAALCGVVGLMPSYGRVSRHGLIAFASSLDRVGPLARSVGDAALALAVVAGHDPHDATSLTEPVPAPADLPHDGAFRFGVPTDALGAGVAADVAARVGEALAALEAAGGERADVALPHASAAVATYAVVAAAEASSNLARYDGVRFGHRAAGAATVDELIRRSRAMGFGPEVKRRILTGTYALSAGYYDAYYRRATQVRALIADDFARAFETCDVIALPTTPATAFPLGAKLADPLAMYLSDVFTVPASLAGLPAVSLPCGLGDDGLPVGVQLVGRPRGEHALLAVAQRLEEALGFARRHALPH